MNNSNRPYLWKANSGTTFKPFANLATVLPAPVRKIDFLSMDMVTKSLEIKAPGEQDESDGLLQSSFAQYLGNTFGFYVTHYILERYNVGRSRTGEGTACIFWRVDAENKVRTGKIMHYNIETGKRDKEKKPTWVHALWKDGKPAFPNFNFSLSFFGEHLINREPEKQIAIVESEKTAVICAFYIPDYIWLATGGASGCKWRDFEVFKVLKNRTIVLFPDFGLYNHKTGKTCFQEWTDRAEIIRQSIPCKISVSTVMEKLLPESYREHDFDLADLLLLTKGGHDMEAVNRNVTSCNNGASPKTP